MKTTNLNLGLFPFGCHPDRPAMFKHPGSATYATDGRNVMGPYSDIQAADHELSMALIARRQRWIARTVSYGCSVAIVILIVLIAFHR